MKNNGISFINVAVSNSYVDSIPFPETVDNYTPDHTASSQQTNTYVRPPNPSTQLTPAYLESINPLTNSDY